MGKGCRLNGVQVIDPVVFESTGGGGGAPGIKPKNYTQGQAPAAKAAAPAAPASAKVAPGDVPF